jgi:MinD-like ATPase involved in chromosome partitioning or flagellar assembly
MTAISVVTVGDSGSRVIDELERARDRVTVVRRCPELAALLAACQSGLAQAAVVAAGAEGLSATLVDRLAAVGVAVVALANGDEETKRLHGIGVTVDRPDVSAAQLAATIAKAVAARAHSSRGGYSHAREASDHSDASPGQDEWSKNDDGAQRSGPTSPGPVAGPHQMTHDAAHSGASAFQAGSRREEADNAPSRGRPAIDAGTGTGDAAAGETPSSEARDEGSSPRKHVEQGRRGRFRPARKRGRSAESLGAGASSRTLRRSRGVQEATVRDTGGDTGGPARLLAVWGPIGSPGRTTIALNMAAELAVTGKNVLVVDADTYGSSMAAALGLLDEAASLAHACRVADQGLLSASELRRIATEVVFAGGTFSLLTGLTRADRWPEVRAAALERVLAAGRELADVVVIDCGFCLENDEELSYDTVAPRRNAAALCALGAADTIYAVGAADAIGMPRLVRAMNELALVTMGAEVTVVLNKARKTATGQSPAKAIEQAWARFGPEQPISHFLPWDSDVTDRALLQGRLLMEVAPESALRRAIAGVVCAPVQRNRKTAVAITTAGR